MRQLSKYWLYTDAFVQNPEPFWEHLRDENPVTRAEAPDGSWVWVLTRYDDVRAALADPRLSRDMNSIYEVLSRQLGKEHRPHPLTTNHLVDVDPPRHTRLRRALAGAFTPRRSDALRPAIERATDALLDELPTGTADLVPGLASPLPIVAVAELMGVPHGDWADFRRWSTALLRTDVTDDTGVLDTAINEVASYMRALIRQKRENPQDDLLSALIHADGEQSLSDQEVLSTGIALMTGGNETTVSMIGGSILTLLANPDVVGQALDDPSLWPTVTEELVRYVTPVNVALKRLTKEPVEYSGVTIPAGEIVIMSILSANRDERQFPDSPEDFDIERPKTQHIAWGHGIHFCVGSHLARIELEAACSRLFQRFSSAKLAVPMEELRYNNTMFLRSLESLPVQL